MPLVNTQTDQVITPEQAQYLQKFSVGALTLGIFYAFGSSLVKEGFLMLIPFYNIYLWIKLMFRGRRLSFERGSWPSFEAFKQRQRLLDRVGVVAVILIALLIGTTYTATKPATDAATRIVQDLAANKAGDVYDQATPELQRTVKKELFVASIANERVFKDFSSVHFSGRGISSTDGVTRAKLSGEVKTTAGQSVPISITLRKVGDAWALTYLVVQSLE